MPTWNVRFDLALDLETPQLVRLVTLAESLARVIRGIPIPPSVRQRLDNLNIVRAVRGTTGIEGSDLTEEEVGLVLNSESGAVLARPRRREEQEVRNAAKAMLFVSQTLKEDPQFRLSEAFVARLHELITSGIDYKHNTPGIYRSHAVSAGTYVPPRDHEEIRRLMKEFVEWAQSSRTRSWPAVVQAIAAHFYFISIHPFGDGNGRTARAIESFYLHQAGATFGFYSLANFYYRRRDEYVDALDATRFVTTGNLTPFVCFALDGLVEELEGVHQEVLGAVAEIAFRDFANEELLFHDKLGKKVGERMSHLLLGLNDPVSIREIRNGRHFLSGLYRGLSAKTLSRDLSFLRQHRLIVIEKGRARANREIMRDFMA